MTVSTSAKLDAEKLRKLILQCDGNVDAAVEELAHSAVAHIRVNIVALDIIDTGQLFRGIKAQRKRRGVWEVSDSVHYGIYHELGTVRMAARPFFLPGINRAVAEFAKQAAEWVFKDTKPPATGGTT